MFLKIDNKAFLSWTSDSICTSVKNANNILQKVLCRVFSGSFPPRIILLHLKMFCDISRLPEIYKCTKLLPEGRFFVEFVNIFKLLIDQQVYLVYKPLPGQSFDLIAAGNRIQYIIKLKNLWLPFKNKRHKLRNRWCNLDHWVICSTCLRFFLDLLIRNGWAIQDFLNLLSPSGNLAPISDTNHTWSCKLYNSSDLKVSVICICICKYFLRLHISITKRFICLHNKLHLFT